MAFLLNGCCEYRRNPCRNNTSLVAKKPAGALRMKKRLCSGGQKAVYVTPVSEEWWKGNSVVIFKGARRVERENKERLLSWVTILCIELREIDLGVSYYLYFGQIYLSSEACPGRRGVKKECFGRILSSLFAPERITTHVKDNIFYVVGCNAYIVPLSLVFSLSQEKGVNVLTNVCFVPYTTTP